ncbi:MAG: AMP-binding protein [Mycobacteriaceae bacterium]|nr:AMP-binding protein [Mycobacteriaceae bacterium]
MADELDQLHREPLPVDLLIRSLDLYADRTAVHIGDAELTYGQLRDEISRYSQAMAALGLGVGSPVAILSANRPEVLFTLSANLVVGVRGAALHPMGSLDDHAYVLEDAGIETLIFDAANYAERAADLAERVPGLKNLVALGESPIGTNLLAAAAAQTPGPLRAPADLDLDAVSSLAYTGGTTGKSKGVMMTYRGSATLLRIQRAEWEWPAEIRHLVCTPLSHAGAAFWNPTAMMGGSMVVLPGFHPQKFLEAVQQYRITSTMLVPTMLYALLDYPDLDKYDTSSLETVFYGASAISPTRLAEAVEKFGPVFVQFYGQAECPMTISVLGRADHDLAAPHRLASCGRAVPWLHVALLDDAGNEVADGEPGEICVRGPLVMKGYLNKPEQTAEATEFGWLHTGDVARRDAEGYLYIIDRKKDMIVSGGFNVFPREVEDTLSAHPAVAGAAVIGVPDEKWGEAVKAVVVLRDGHTVAAEELQALVKDRKGAVYTPKSVDFVDRIPVTGIGKPDKKALRARYWSDTTRQVN